MYTAYDRGILIEGHISTFDDDRTPEEAASRLKGTSQSRRFVWRKFWERWDGIGECENRITEVPEQSDYPRVRVHHNKVTGKTAGYVNGKPVFMEWSTYPYGTPRVGTLRGMIPIDEIQGGDVFLGMPETIPPTPLIAKPKASPHRFRKITFCFGWALMVAGLVFLWVRWPA